MTFGRDGPQFDADRVRVLLKVREGVSVPTEAAMNLAPAAKRATGEAKPEVLLQVASRTMSQPFGTPTPQQIFNIVCTGRRREEGHTHRRPECGPW